MQSLTILFLLNTKFTERVILMYFKFHKENYKNRIYFSSITYTDFYSGNKYMFAFIFFETFYSRKYLSLPTNAKLTYISLYKKRKLSVNK